MNEALTQTQLNVIQALVSGSSITSAAEAAGCSRKTICNWMNKGEFAVRLNCAQKEIWEQNRHRLQSLSVSACDRLAQLVESGDERVALAAVKLLLSRGDLFADSPTDIDEWNLKQLSDELKKQV